MGNEVCLWIFVMECQAYTINLFRKKEGLGTVFFILYGIIVSHNLHGNLPCLSQKHQKEFVWFTSAQDILVVEAYTAKWKKST